MYAILLFPGETSTLNYVLFFFFSQHEVGEFRLIPFPTVSESFFFLFFFSYLLDWRAWLLYVCLKYFWKIYTLFSLLIYC